MKAKAKKKDLRRVTAFEHWVMSQPKPTNKFTVNIPLTLDFFAWCAYTRAAKARGQKLEVMLSEFLQEQDCDFQIE